MSESVVLSLIDANPFQPRKSEDPEAIKKIAESIRAVGLLQIPSARKAAGRYELAFGHTRRAALEYLGETVMPLNVVELTDLQMFEAAVSENIQRRDLNPIEVAGAMQRYMSEFGKTSDECGEFFGVSGATVRGKVRLLELPAEGQARLSDGSISEGTARALLSMARVASEEQINVTIQHLVTNEDGEMPESIIEQDVENLDTVVEMWNDRRGSSAEDARPRSTWTGGWLLDMKNFPNKFLPMLTAEDAALGLGIMEEEGAMSAVNSWLGGWQNGFENLESEEFRGLPETHQDKLRHLLAPPACSACAFYTKVRGSHYCGMKVCHERKMTAWKSHFMGMASKSLGIPIYAVEDGKFKILDYGEHDLFDAHHPDLRLVLRKDVPGHQYQWLKGVPECAYVVVVGEALKEMAEQRKETISETRSEASESRDREQWLDDSKQALQWEAALSVKGLFDGLNDVVIRTLYTTSSARFNGAPDAVKEPEEENAEEWSKYMRRCLAYMLLEEGDWQEYRDWETCMETAEGLMTVAKTLGVTLPSSVQAMAVQLDAGGVAVETKARGKGRKK